MEASESKKLALLYVLDILRRETDLDHPLRQEEIGRLLSSRYGITLERKAIGRNLALLREAGYDIPTVAGGSYLGDRDFEPAELRLLIDSVLFSRHINPIQSRTLAERLAALGGKHFAMHRRHVSPSTVAERNKNESSQLFLAIELADEAIERGERLRFDYRKHGIDKRLHKSSEHEVSPYQMLLHNQHYYLMAYSEAYGKIVYYRMDKMAAVRPVALAAIPLRSLPGYEGGIDYGTLSTSFPYLFSEPPVPVTFSCPEWLVDQVVDWFGYGFSLRPSDGRDTVLVTVCVSPAAMEYWALQYARYVRILSPRDLRQRVAATLKSAAAEYEDGGEQTI